VIATHANGSLVGPANMLPGATPTVPGEVIVVYGTGFGPTSPAVDGLVLSSPANLARRRRSRLVEEPRPYNSRV
jgi:uncharacterized protein (TIGR03437 family)